MPNGIVRVPSPVNEPVKSYAPGSPEKASLKKRLDRMMSEKIEIPLIIGGKEIKTGSTAEAVCPFDHSHVLATYHQAGAPEVALAIEESQKAWRTWSEMRWEDRAAVFLKAAELLAGPWRDTINAATMLNQAKTVHQAEIDSACELIDFLRFNPHYMQFIYEQQPESSPLTWNYVEYRALEGFVFAVTPFNFTSIAGNLPTSAAMMGNVVLWKPASSAVLSAYYILRMLEEAGLPPGVINFIPGKASQVGDPVLDSPLLAGIHFTGSTGVFQSMWKKIGANIHRYHSYPRIVGETGGKDFIFAHPTADVPSLVTALVRGAFEYQGQKCSAASRAYIPRSLWDDVKKGIGEQLSEIRTGPPTDFRNFFSAVIDANSFRSIKGYLDFAKSSDDAEIIFGGKCDDSRGYFVEPTVVLTKKPDFRLMCEEIFGPVLTIHVYEDAAMDAALESLDTASPYALTGAIFARDRGVIADLSARLRHAAGNFYINDKPTGAVVGQQPFGGSRASGTNDKAGSYLNLIRWVSMRTVKENFVPPVHFGYPFLEEK
ncbi:MAG TPA: L-glutamate gamma-semialdehyde dehydrogenase [Thermoanaerobaculia bacterium]|nr:L-glutamate gamma-semialdehyde dehydrogenase [Thermoanaerobaculia bacterium]